MTRIVIDPVTRAGGQLRVEAETAEGRVTDAWVSTTSFRGIEAVLRGRDPRDAWLLAQRICGTCTGVHGAASVRAVEQALGIVIPTNARLLRNILAGTVLIRDHVMTLYQRMLADWVDTEAALRADPAATAKLAEAQGASSPTGATRFREVRDRLAAAMATGPSGPFASAFPGHPAYRLSPEQDLLLIAHFLDALDWQRDFMRLHTLLSGKEAHPQTYLVGGMALAPPWGGPDVSRTRQHPPVPDRDAPLALSDEGFTLMRRSAAEARRFVQQVVLPDTRLLLAAYPDWVATGASTTGYLCAGEFPETNGPDAAMLFPAGVLAADNLQRSAPVDQASMAESVAHAWYASSDSNAAVKAPAEGETVPAWSGQVPLTQLDGNGKYTWTKAARIDRVPVETGALARVLVGLANGRAEVRDALGRALVATDLEQDAIGGALGRALARAVELDVVTTSLGEWISALEASLATGDTSIASIELWDPTSWPAEAEGWSLGEGPRGSVGHWLRIKDAVIDHYQVIDGSTWNTSPRDGLGAPGPMEAALRGIAVADPARPIEVLRVVHSFAPCAACAAHVLEAPR